MLRTPAVPARRTLDADHLVGPDGPVTVPDPYRWLEDANSAETRTWAATQDSLLDEHRAAWASREHFATRVNQLLGAGFTGMPTWRGKRQFFMQRRPGQEHAVLLTVDPDGTQRVLVDPMHLDPSGLTTLDAWSPSQEGDLVAVQISTGGSEESVLSVLDVATGATVDGPIDRARYSPVSWFPGATTDGATASGAFLYVRRLDPAALPADQAQYHRRVWLHTLGADPATDVEIFGAGRDLRTYYGCSVSRDGRWMTVSASVGTEPRTSIWLADLHASSPESPAFKAVQDGVDARTSVGVGRDGRLYIWTDRDAPRGRVCVADPQTPTAEHWVDLIAEDPVAVLDDFAILDGEQMQRPELIVGWTRHALSEITRHDVVNGDLLGRIDLPGLGSIGGLGERPEGGHEMWWTWTDATTPGTVLHLDARTGVVAVWAEPPGQVQVPDVQVRQVVVDSPDGTKVRLLVVAPTTTPDRPRPTILYGYGGFGISMTPGYSAGILAWVEAGGVYAVASLRGGGEEGEGWHRAGMLARKAATFADFHACAEWLIASGTTTSAMLGISGGSNGGLLVGAALTARPDLYRSVVCSAPLLDMVRYEQFGLGSTWNVEYGSARVPEELGWLLSYSPYHHVRPDTAYPAVLFTVFDGDTRVDPLHARKMCAALQNATSSSPDTHPILIRAEGDVGHGARALSRSVTLSADTLAFQAAHLGLSTGQD